MRLCLNHGFKYEAEQIGLLFFPKHEELSLKSEIFEENGETRAVCTAEYEGRTANAERRAVCLTKKDTGDLIKLSAYDAAKKLSDLPSPWGILTGIRPAKPVLEMLENGADDEEIRRVFKNRYLVSDEKIELALLVAKAERGLVSRDDKNISLYIGIPFCPTRCIYCSFVSHDAGRMIKLADEYTEKLCLEIARTSELAKELGMNVRSVYFGGGTPTALSAENLGRLFSAVRSNIDLTRCTEYTVEAGRPDTVTFEKLSAIQKGGAGRISINPQTASDETLRLIGRNHTYNDFLNAFELARSMGFDNINCDVIAGLPNENISDFEKTMQKLCALSPENLTVHTLYIKRASRLRSVWKYDTSPGEISLMVDAARKMCTENGYKPYYLYKQKSTLGNLENVGYSKPGLECIYNIDTMSDKSHVFALGAGGVTKIVLGNRIERIFNFKNADDYIIKFDEILNRKSEAAEILLTESGKI